MAEDINNKTLAILVGLAIVISLAGIMFTPKGVITGQPISNSTSEAKLNVTGSAELTVNDAVIDFKEGAVSGDASEICVLDSYNDSTGYATATENVCGDGFLGTTTGGTTADYFVVNNTGSGDYQLDVYGDGYIDFGKANYITSDVKVVNTIGSPTCDLTTYEDFTNSNNRGNEVNLCDTLGENDAVYVAMRLNINGSTPQISGGTEPITFLGTII